MPAAAGNTRIERLWGKPSRSEPVAVPVIPAGDFAWTDERVERLKVLYREEKTMSQIAAALGGVTRNAVIGKIHRIGLPPRGGRIGKTAAAPPPLKVVRPPPAQLRREPPPQTRLEPSPHGPPDQETVVPDPPPSREEGISACVELFDLRDRHCRWPVDQAEGPIRYCGAPRTLDRPQGDLPCPYCAFHAAMAYQPQRSERQRAGDESRRRLAFQREREKRAASGGGGV